MAYTNWGNYTYNDATGQFDRWVEVVPGSSPPLAGETRDEYEVRMKCQVYGECPASSGFLLPAVLIGGLVLLGMLKRAKRV